MGTSGGEENGDNPFANLVNVGTNVMTGGLVGYENGGFVKGATTNGLGEALGEITGRNLQREALGEQKNALNRQKAADAEAKALDLKQREIDDTASSNAAGTAQNNRRIRALMAQQGSATAGGALGTPISGSYLGL